MVGPGPESGLVSNKNIFGQGQETGLTWNKNVGRQGTGVKAIQGQGTRYSQGHAIGVARERRPETGLDSTESNVGLGQETWLARDSQQGVYGHGGPNTGNNGQGQRQETGLDMT
jgi:hypothetical protein